MRTPTPRRFGWSLVLVGGLAWLSIGCSPATLSMLMMPWSDNKIDPEYKLFADSKEINLVILSNFAQSEFRAEINPADTELAARVAEFLRKRCNENKHKLKIVPHTQVRNFQEKEQSSGEFSAMEAGKHFKADFVLDLTIQSLSLFEKNSYPKMFRGSTEISVNLYKMNVKEGDNKVFSKDYRTEYPSRGPIDAGNSNPASFRNLLLAKVARDVTKMLIAFPPEERMPTLD